MSLISQALVTADEADAYLQNQNADHDDVIEQIINSVSQEFSTFCSRNFISATYTALKLDGTGTASLFLPDYPVSALTSVAEDGVARTVDVDFYADLDTGILTKISFNWPWDAALAEGTPYWIEKRQAILVTYTAGYAFASLPSDIKGAALREIGRQYKLFITKGEGETSSSVSGSSTTYAATEPAWVATMKRYRRIHI